MKRAKKILVILLGLSSAIVAHPGHGHEGGSFGLLHYLTEPLHFGVGIIFVLIVGIGVYFLKQKRIKTIEIRKK